MTDQSNQPTQPIAPVPTPPAAEGDAVDVEVKGNKIKLTVKGGLIIAGILIIIITGATILTSAFDVFGCQHVPVKVKVEKQVR